MSMNHAIKLRHIRLFLEIADRGNLSAAAQSLGLSQPALSKSLAETELLLGGALFLRQGRRLILTAAGDAFRRHIRAAMIHLDNAATVFAPEKPQGRISVGVLPTVSTQFFPQVAAQFLTASPQVTLAIESGPHDYLLQKLREGRVDLMIGRMPDAIEMAGISFEYLYEEPIVLVARHDHPLLQGNHGPNVAEVLRNSALILPARDAIIRKVIDDYLISLDLGGIRPAVETSTLALGRGLLLNADAVWFISRGVVANELATGALRVIAHGASYLAGAVGVSRLQGGDQMPSITLLLDLLRSTAQTRPNAFVP